MRSSLEKFIVLGALAFFVGGYSAKAEPLSAITPLDQQVSSLPSWLVGLKEEKGMALASKEFEVTLPENTSSEDLALTLYFQDGEEGFLRVLWSNGNYSQMVCSNALEGLKASNQRTFLIPRELFQEGKGRLMIQSSHDKIPVYKVFWQWVASYAVRFPARVEVPAIIGKGRKHISKMEVMGESLLPLEDSWEGSVINAPMLKRIEKISESLSLVAKLESPPKLARFVLKISGLGLGEGVSLWVNGKHVGKVSIDVPSLTDPSFYRKENRSLHYSGWRDGFVWMDETLLKQGDNDFIFKLQRGKDNSSEPVFIKEATLQMGY